MVLCNLSQLCLNQHVLELAIVLNLTRPGQPQCTSSIQLITYSTLYLSPSWLREDSLQSFLMVALMEQGLLEQCLRTGSRQVWASRQKPSSSASITLDHQQLSGDAYMMLA